MIARLRSWWKNTSKTLDVVVILMLVVLLAVIVVSILGYAYNLNWSGLHGKTFWDWLQLLIIPAVLAVGGYLFNYTTSRNEQAIASDNQSEAAMKEYFDKMSELLLHEKLRVSGKDDEVRMIARVLTLTVLVTTQVSYRLAKEPEDV
jgi:ABC-type multidrug transport system fused ATPase/permease subunit